MGALRKWIEDALPPKWRGGVSVSGGNHPRPGSATVHGDGVGRYEEGNGTQGRVREDSGLHRPGRLDGRAGRGDLERQFGNGGKFHCLKSIPLMRVIQIFHRMSKLIRVQAFLRVIGLLSDRWIQGRVAEGIRERLHF